MRINVKVIANSSKEEVVELDEKGCYKVYLKKPAVEGKANKELVSLLKKYFKKPVQIVKGKTSKNKIVEIKEVD